MLFYIPGTQGRLFRSQQDKYIRSASGKKLKLIDVEGRWLTEKDLENLVYVEKRENKNLVLSYSDDKKILIEEYNDKE